MLESQKSLDIPEGMTLQDVAPDGRVLVSLDHERLRDGDCRTKRQALRIFPGTIGMLPKIFRAMGNRFCLRMPVRPQGRTIRLPFAKSTAHRPCNWVKEVQVDSRRTANG